MRMLIPVSLSLTLVLLVATYATCYFVRSELVVGETNYWPLSIVSQRVRIFPTQFEAIIFVPAAKLESLVVGCEVEVTEEPLP